MDDSTALLPETVVLPFFDDEKVLVCTLIWSRFRLGFDGEVISLMEGPEEALRWRVPSVQTGVFDSFLTKCEGDQTPQDTLFRYSKIAYQTVRSMVTKKNEENRARRKQEFRDRLNRLPLHEAAEYVVRYFKTGEWESGRVIRCADGGFIQMLTASGCSR